MQKLFPTEGRNVPEWRRLNPAELKQVAKEINLSKPLAFDLSANADVASSKAKFNASLSSELLKLKSLSGVYGLSLDRKSVV